ncbi:MAG: hypothetical protein U0821_03350 [Chloroflexota bacterium]
MPAHDPLRAQMDALVEEAVRDQPDAAAMLRLSVLLNRAAAELHRRARNQAATNRGTDAWGDWAGLQNAVRGLVLQTSTTRDLAAKLVAKNA